MPRRPRQWKSRGKRAPEAHAKKAIPIDDTTAEAITEQKRLFREKFGREPGPDDPLFLIPSPQCPNFSALNHRKKPGELSCRQPESLGWTQHWSTR